jgi:hypothetical protein
VQTIRHSVTFGRDDGNLRLTVWKLKTQTVIGHLVSSRIFAHWNNSTYRSSSRIESFRCNLMSFVDDRIARLEQIHNSRTSRSTPRASASHRLRAELRSARATFQISCQPLQSAVVIASRATKENLLRGESRDASHVPAPEFRATKTTDAAPD